MAFCDDRKFLLSHIRHSFITCDDTGMCEVVMLNETMPTHLPGEPDVELLDSLDVESRSELLETSQSYDIMSDMELIGAHRRRSNTAQRLERLKKERKNQAKLKIVTWKSRENSHELTDTDLEELFPIKNVDADKKAIKKSALSAQLEKFPSVPSNPFNEYARFDGRVSEGAPTKRIIIYLTMLPAETKSCPMEVVSLASARVYDLIGLICWQYTNEGKEPKLRPNVENYCLRIAEENGDVDPDFPSLNPKEPVAKFGFPYLALVEKQQAEVGCGVVVTVYIDEVFSKIPVSDLDTTLQDILEIVLKKRRAALQPGVDYKLEKCEEPGYLDLRQTLAEVNCLEFNLVVTEISQVEDNEQSSSNNFPDMSAMEAPLYQSYTVLALHTFGRSCEVRFGISGEKIEVTPLVLGHNKIWHWQPKPATCNVENIVDCEIVGQKFNTGRAALRVTYHNGTEFKPWTFEVDSKTTYEIYRKLQNVMQMRTSPIRNQYNSLKNQKKERKTSHH